MGRPERNLPAHFHFTPAGSSWDQSYRDLVRRHHPPIHPARNVRCCTVLAKQIRNYITAEMSTLGPVHGSPRLMRSSPKFKSSEPASKLGDNNPRQIGWDHES